jgi:futalosine hydrolase
MGHSPPLILVPTRTEGQVIRDAFLAAGRGDLDVILCGFGPIAAAARTADLLARQRPPAVILIGIAGGFAECGELGQAYRFGRVASFGVGAGTAAAFQSAASLGWPQLAVGQAADASQQNADVITLQTKKDAGELDRLLLTACAASATEADVQLRQKHWPDAFAEDMEGFGVALACHQQATPCMIIRGLSNWVGDREKRHWTIDTPLRAAAALALESLASL